MTFRCSRCGTAILEADPDRIGLLILFCRGCAPIVEASGFLETLGNIAGWESESTSTIVPPGKRSDA